MDTAQTPVPVASSPSPSPNPMDTAQSPPSFPTGALSFPAVFRQ
jgi:hypothetical protein